MKISVGAIHEAGHAVVAAYLRHPFTYVTVENREWNGKPCGGFLRFKSSYGRYRTLSRHRTSFHEGIPEFCYRDRPDDEIQRSIASQQERKLIKQALLILAARAAVDAKFKDYDCESDYKSDEEDLVVIADALGVATVDYTVWRAIKLAEATKIVMLQHVSLAIFSVACELDFLYNQNAGKGRMMQKQVIAELRQAEEYLMLRDAA